MSRGNVLLATAAAAAVAGVFPVLAQARISPATVIDGPSVDVLELGGTAIAEDGTGGVVYRKREDGRSHIFAARFAGGGWQPPQRVDAGQQFDSTFPRIAAGVGGRLLVVWVQELGPGTDRLYSASADPGSTIFEKPSSVDFNIGEATSTFPSVAMNAGGTAYVAYRVITGTTGVPTGYVRSDLRLARFNGMTWSVVGNLNRNPANPVREPTLANSARVGVAVDGDALLAFQEPDDGLVDRIWARRMFGTTAGVPLLVSATSYNGTPINGSADQFSLASAGFGAAAVAYRQQPGAGDPLGGPRVMVNTIHERFLEDSGQFLGARVVEAGAGAIGEASVGIAIDGSFLVAFASASGEQVAAGDDGAVYPTTQLGEGLPGAVGDPLATLGGELGGVAAWRLRDGDAHGVGIHERPSDTGRGTRTAVVSAPVPGELSDLTVGGSGRGDALVAFRQGGASGGAIAASVVDAPPGSFAVSTPIGWVRPKKATIGWDPAPDAIGGVHYEPLLRGRTDAGGITSLNYTFRPHGLADGRYRVQVRATDAAGQQTLSGDGELKVDATAPRVSVRAGGDRRLKVRIVDGKRGKSSGFTRKGSLVTFGDGRRSKAARTVHRYKHKGSYRVVIVAKDRAGNRTRSVRRIRVR